MEYRAVDSQVQVARMQARFQLSSLQKLFVLLACGWASCINAPQLRAEGDIDASLVAALKGEAQKAWKNLASQRGRGEIIGRKEIRGVLPKRADGTSPDDLVVIRDVRIARDVSRGQMLSISRPIGFPAEAGAWGVRNKEYTFSTTRKSGTDQFVLGNVRKVRNVSGSEERWESRQDSYLYPFDAAYSIGFCPLWEFDDLSLFRLKSCRWIAGDAGPNEFAEATYICLSSPSVLTLEVGGEYTVLLEPRHSWRLKRAEVKGGPSNRHMTWDVDYVDDASNGFYPTKVTTTIRVIGREGHDVETFTFGPLMPLTFKDEDFRLAGYGFPESIVDVPVTGRWFRILCIVGAILFLGIGFWFFLRMDRRRRVAES